MKITIAQLNEIAERGRITFCTELRNIRQQKGMLQKDVAEELGVPLSTYANWEQGRRAPSIGEIFKILTVFDISANDLFVIL